ncbi:Cytosine-specific methyltransferase [Rubrivivax sp. A210]|uniref:DNA cytosine methyltransferase n=1 Tax=Rubrivivax sp. A210 TaxID=2772301 RepID=UPI00191A1222|nr:DNA cytosine methyltransferase [Rubrivivax sp. A210]CAD5373371.1 Cytosine-specific methyltransferase [Rubrivivax sp. A210]
MERWSVFDLFCGTGGFSYGMESSNLGFDTRLGVDVLPVARTTFHKNHKRAVSICCDIRKLRRAEVAEATKLGREEVDIIVGGPPCQGFSSIRPFRSTNDDDPRNNLFEEYASYVNYFRPKVFVLENVVGLATHKDGATIDSMQECFEALGYRCEWRILNAAHYGVPQKRERLVMIGGRDQAKPIFPEPTHAFSGSTIGYRDRSRVVRAVGQDLFSAQLPEAMTVMDAIGDLPPIESGDEATSYTSGPLNAYQAARRENATELRLHNATAHSRKMLEIIRHSGRNIDCIPRHLITSGFSSSYSRLDADEPSVTLTVNFVHPASNRCIHPEQDRALTPREGARIQSFDDGFEFAGNRTQIAKQIGNAVPPLLGKAIAGSISRMLG